MRSSVIVVTDDQPQVLGFIKVLLRGYDVKAFSSPVKAREFLETLNEDPALLITDIVMPHGDGRDLALAFQARFPRMPVLLMSGYAPGMLDVGDLPESWSFLAKPFSPSELRASVTGLIGRK